MNTEEFMSDCERIGRRIADQLPALTDGATVYDRGLALVRILQLAQSNSIGTAPSLMARVNDVEQFDSKLNFYLGVET